MAGAVERRRSGRRGGCGAKVRGPGVEEVSRAASRCHDGAAPVGAGCSPAPAPPPGGVCLPLPSLLRRGRRHCPALPPGPGQPPPRPPASFPPPNMVGLWLRWRQRPARSATPFSFLCLYPRGRLLARLIFGPRPALCPPPLPRRVALTEAGPLEARFPRLPRSGVLNPLPPARCRVPEPCGCRVPTAAPRTAHLPSPPAPGTYPAAECFSSSWGAL